MLGHRPDKSYSLVRGHHFEAKTPATNQNTDNKSHPRAVASIRHQDTGNKWYNSVLGHHFETKKPCIFVLGHHFKTGNKWYILVLGTASRPRHQQDTGNKTYISVLGHHFEPRHHQQIVHLCADAPLRNQESGNKVYIFVLGTTSKPNHRQQIVYLTTPIPRHRQQIVHLSAGAPIRDQDTGNKSWSLVLGNHFDIKILAINRRSQCLGTTSRPRLWQQIVHLSAGAPLRYQDTGTKSHILPLQYQDTGNKSYILVLGHYFETKTPATNRTFQCWRSRMSRVQSITFRKEL